MKKKKPFRSEFWVRKFQIVFIIIVKSVCVSVHFIFLFCEFWPLLQITITFYFYCLVNELTSSESCNPGGTYKTKLKVVLRYFRVDRRLLFHFNYAFFHLNNFHLILVRHLSAFSIVFWIRSCDQLCRKAWLNVEKIFR